jgi:PhnB protein
MIPYLTVDDGAAAIDFYRAAFGAVEVMRLAMDDQDGRIGHAELQIGDARIYLSDEFLDLDVVSPRRLGGTTVALYLVVDDVDATYTAATAAGALPVRPPAEQPHGSRQATVHDPFGHRWMLSQPIETVTPAPAHGGIWAAINYADALAGIRFMIDVLGFTEELVVTGERADVVEHSQLRWPEGGVVQAATANRPGNVFSARPVGSQSLYVITADPAAVYERCVAAGVDVVQPPMSPDYDPDGLVFSIRDVEGNLWSFGTYAGGS